MVTARHLLAILMLVCMLCTAADVEVVRAPLTTDEPREGEGLKLTYTVTNPDPAAIKVELVQDIPLSKINVTGIKPDFRTSFEPTTSVLTIMFPKVPVQPKKSTTFTIDLEATKYGDVEIPPPTVRQDDKKIETTLEPLSFRISMGARRAFIIIYIIILVPVLFWCFMVISYLVSSKKGRIMMGLPVEGEAIAEPSVDEKVVVAEETDVEAPVGEV
ncbi:MAG: BatD family protein [Candidatus Undinarchaeales archaeon]|nr:BatD family protein [Candidatus Undinarchaeales archaeon]MDP7492093.1 BatD family protein [Candidatus Undinarchaeales archaeon]